ATRIDRPDSVSPATSFTKDPLPSTLMPQMGLPASITGTFADQSQQEISQYAGDPQNTNSRGDHSTHVPHDGGSKRQNRPPDGGEPQAA
ncbi:MAG: hypothetical protein ACPHJ3_16725, partial [Rubripirellula sp.]